MCIRIIDQPDRQGTPDVNGKLNNVDSLIKAIKHNKLLGVWKPSIFVDSSTPIDIQSTGSKCKYQLASLGSNEEEFEESNPQRLQGLACKIIINTASSQQMLQINCPIYQTARNLHTSITTHWQLFYTNLPNQLMNCQPISSCLLNHCCLHLSSVHMPHSLLLAQTTT